MPLTAKGQTVYEHMIVVRDKSRAIGPAKAVLFALASRADNNGEAFPSLSRLAKDAGVSRSTVTRVISLLERLGELIVVRGKKSTGTSGGIQTVNTYKLKIDV